VSYIACLSLALAGLLTVANFCAAPKAKLIQAALSHLPNSDDTPTRVDFCELVKNPTKYDQKLVAVEAIEVVNTVDVVDGADPFLYSPKCDDPTRYYVYLDAADRQNHNPKAIDVEKKIVESASTLKQSARVRVLIVGQFHFSLNGGFGHLDWARTKISVTRLENAEQVGKSVSWPASFKSRK